MNRALLLLAIVALGCVGPKSPEVAGPVDATSAVGHECAVCGMIVDEQPAPRGQVLHRGGERRFACSIGDLRAYLQAPSPLGDPTRVWGEALPSGWAPGDSDPTLLPWLPASDAAFVVGFERSGIMGLPVASFESAGDAGRTAAAIGGRTTTWSDLAKTPFNKLPTAP